MSHRSVLPDSRAILWLRSFRGWRQLELAQAAGVDIATLRRAEAGERVTAACLTSLANALDVGLQDIAFPQTLATDHWSVPRVPSPLFVGRTDILLQLSNAFRAASRRSEAPTRRVALVGMPGVGKSEIACQFAVRQQAGFGDVYWIDAASSDGGASCLNRIGTLLGVRRNNDPEVYARAVFAALTHSTDWLLVIDGVETQPPWWSQLPRDVASGHVLLTTANEDSVPSGFVRVDVPNLPDSDAVDFLLLRGGRGDLLCHRSADRCQEWGVHRSSSSRKRRRSAAATAMSPREEGELQAATSLTLALGNYLPALEAIAAFVSARRCSYTTFVDDHWRRFRFPRTVRAPWRRGLAAVEAVAPTAARLIRLLSVAAVAPIPTDLAIDLAHTESVSTADAQAALSGLVRRSLVAIDTETQQYTLHCIAHESIERSLTRSQRARLRSDLCEVMKRRFPTAPLAEQQALEPHVRRCIEYARSVSDRGGDMAQLVRALGCLFLQTGQLGDAETYLKLAVRRLSEAFGPTDIDVAKTQSNLGMVYGQMGQHEKAKRRFAVAARAIANLSEVPPSVLRDATNNRALAALGLGEYRAAERFLKECIALSPRQGSARYRNNLGALCEEQKRYEEALEHYREALDIRMEVAAGDHAQAAHCLNNLGRLLLILGHQDEAEERLVAAVKEWRKSPGSRIELASALNNLGELYLEMGRQRQADSHLRSSLELRRSVLPEKHRHIALSYLNLARLEAASPRGRASAFAWARQARRILDEVGNTQELAGQVNALRAALPGRSATLQALERAVQG
ncbi:MAG: tetratricopeptide repeat protein [Planctomycetota bacterium]